MLYRAVWESGVDVVEIGTPRELAPPLYGGETAVVVLKLTFLTVREP